MSLPNPSMSFTPFDQLPASDLNDIVENVEALAAGTGLDDGVVTSEKLTATVGFIARRTTNQAITGGNPPKKVTCDTEDKDFGNDYDNSTNYRFTAPVDGLYHFSGQASLSAVPERIALSLYKNGSAEIDGPDIETSIAGGAIKTEVTGDIYLTTGQYVELYILIDDSTNITSARFSGYLVGQG